MGEFPHEKSSTVTVCYIQLRWHGEREDGSNPRMRICSDMLNGGVLNWLNQMRKLILIALPFSARLIVAVETFFPLRPLSRHQNKLLSTRECVYVCSQKSFQSRLTIIRRRVERADGKT